ncbi:hypothetical protein A2872_03215 [Candidatus Gottesmanbacteria bacterium RIFCSPHIGHO2_01_FULL_42_12]|uniref:SAM-dependent methyltransferase n=1 Tax=Candidatus Gottesmanbacteria bacterium RIFCSPHIGHO2_01_FULL_42_12 TaxID=1798377 RepID=A0A1F5Z017_9BACT|nr:MAG: hypothetical protein A2872_03215 [Candidatus Gottesmanbacteria bacterium RIFCSPHIGHO2_01_FULL_42_12]
MSTKGGKIGLHRFGGNPRRFEVVAQYIYENYHGQVKYIADVAGGQGMLSRILHKKYNFESEVIDPRGYSLLGVPARQTEYQSDMATFYDLIVGLHPDEALVETVTSALFRPTIVIPCCNFWSRDEKLGRDALIEKLSQFYRENNIEFTKVIFDFEGPKNIGLVTSTKN